jgi:glucose-6-phosphate 1-dehydrogenase
MPAIDNCHQQLANSLMKQDWKIDPKPLVLQIPSTTRQVFVDIVARRQLTNIEQEIIILEVKCFSEQRSQLEHLYVALGQYQVYEKILRARNMAEYLYLAIPLHAYHGIFKEIGSAIAKEKNIKLLVFDIDKEEIVEWLP